MKNIFSGLVSRFYEVKDQSDIQQLLELIQQMNDFAQQYCNVIEVAEQSMVAEVLEMQLILNVLVDQRNVAVAIEQQLDDEFYGVHRIGKAAHNNLNGSYRIGGLNIPARLLDFQRIAYLVNKQKGATKASLLGWSITAVGVVLVALSFWLFTVKWLWTPLVVGFIGVVVAVIGTRIRNMVSSFLSTFAFDTGVLVPGIIVQADDKGYEALFMAPMMASKRQAERWGLTRIAFKKEAGNFTIGDRLAAVCVFGKTEQEFYDYFMVTPVCLGVSFELVVYRAKQVIADEYWQRLAKLQDQYQVELKLNEQLMVDDNLQKIAD